MMDIFEKAYRDGWQRGRKSAFETWTNSDRDYWDWKDKNSKIILQNKTMEAKMNIAEGWMRWIWSWLRWILLGCGVLVIVTFVIGKYVC